MRRFVLPAALVVASLSLSLLLGEGLLRLTGFSYPSFFVPDELTGSRLRAGLEGWQRGEGEAHVRINSAGFRDSERALAKPPGTVRIAVLGDSFTEALSVPHEKSFPAQLERELVGCRAFGDRRVEVLNFGVSGYGTAQELLVLRHRAARYSPDVVLLAFFPGNDVRNNSRALEPEKLRPFFVERGGRLALDDSFARDPKFLEARRLDEQRAALQDLRLYQLMRRVRAGEIQLRHNAPVAMALADGKARPLEAGLDENVYREPPNDTWRDAWSVTERLLAQMNSEVKAGNGRFVVAVLSSAGSVYPDPAWRKRYMAQLGVEDLFYPERRLERFGREQGFEVLPLAPALQRQADEQRAYLHGFRNTRLGFGHWNEAGHAAAGRLIARHLCARAG
jgi:lysophospholipase L1-like esterase